MQPDAVDTHPPLLRAFDLDAHGAECGQGRERVLAFEKALGFGDALRERAQHDAAMGDGFIAGHTDTPLQTAAWMHLKTQ